MNEHGAPKIHEIAFPQVCKETSPAVLRVENLHMRFEHTRKLFSATHKKSYVHALNGVSFSIGKGETLGLVGESGCGKSTVANTIVQLYQAQEGAILYEGRDITKLSKKEALAIRKNIQIVFQDPYSSLNPRMTVHAILAEPLQIYQKHGLINMTFAEIEHRIEHILHRVGLPPVSKYRYPHNFSGGQRQRISIAHALMLEPKIILADEAVSALDVSIQAQIINLFKELQQELGLSILFISHDLVVVKHISHRVAIMYCGKIVEEGTSDQIYHNPQHPYTKALLSAVNIPDPRLEKERQRIILSGNVLSLDKPPVGCPFYERCAHAMPKCNNHLPKLQTKDTTQQVACFLYSDNEE